MIRAEELRIGNLIMDRGVVVKLGRAMFVNIIEGKYIEAYKPIELTEEILIEWSPFWYDKDEKTYKINDFTIQLDDYGDEGFMIIVFGNDVRLIKSLHELQNFFKEFTDQELPINIKKN